VGHNKQISGEVRINIHKKFKNLLINFFFYYPKENTSYVSQV